MSGSNLSALSDKLGEVRVNTPVETAAALVAAMKAAQSREEAERFAAMLGLNAEVTP